MPDRDTLTVIIDNREIIVESASFIRTMDTGADACSAAKDIVVVRTTAAGNNTFLDNEWNDMGIEWYNWINHGLHPARCKYSRH